MSLLMVPATDGAGWGCPWGFSRISACTNKHTRALAMRLITLLEGCEGMKWTVFKERQGEHTRMLGQRYIQICCAGQPDGKKSRWGETIRRTTVPSAQVKVQVHLAQVDAPVVKHTQLRRQDAIVPARVCGQVAGDGCVCVHAVQAGSCLLFTSAPPPHPPPPTCQSRAAA